MTDKRVMPDHEDLEERIYISTEIEFSTEGATFSGLPELDIKIKSTKPQQRIQHREDGKRKSNKQLF